MKKIKIINPEDYKYLSSLKRLIIFSTIIFVSSVLIGFVSTIIYPEKIKILINPIQDLAEKARGLNDLELFGLIFINNGIKIIAVILLGIFLGIIPLFFLFINGYLVGVVAFLTQEIKSWSVFWFRILPHGILEIPALIIGAGMGIKLGNSFLNSVSKKERRLKKDLKEAIVFSVRFLVPLIFIAAFIEVFVSRIIISII